MSIASAEQKKLFKCSRCQKSFGGHKRQYCSVKCRRKAHNQRVQYDGRLHDRCICGSRKRKTSLFCKVCTTEASKVTVVTNCERCGGKIVNKSSKCINRFCSKRCNLGERRIPKIVRRLARLLKSRLSKMRRQCECGKLFDPDGKERYCEPCKVKKAEQYKQSRESTYEKKKRIKKNCQCGRCFQVYPGHAFKKRLCNRCSNVQMRGNRRDRERAALATADTVCRVSVFARDNWLCQMCRATTAPHDEATEFGLVASLDHIIPISLGGQHTVENTMCLCFSCNSRKSAKIVATNLESGQVEIID